MYVVRDPVSYHIFLMACKNCSLREAVTSTVVLPVSATWHMRPGYTGRGDL